MRKELDKAGITPTEATARIKEVCPGFDRPMLSKLDKPEHYGVRLTAKAQKALFGSGAGNALKSRRSDGHKLTDRVSCRLEKTQYARLQKLIEASGHRTMQEALSAMIEEYTKEG